MTQPKERAVWLWVIAGVIGLFVVCGSGAVFLGQKVVDKVRRRKATEEAVVSQESGRNAEAATLYRKLLGDDPDNPDLHTELARSLEDLGDRVRTERGAGAVLETYQEGLEHIVVAAGLRPDDARITRIRYVLEERVGEAFLDLYELAEAEDSFRRSLALREVVCAAEPGNLKHMHDLAVIHDRIGDVEERRSRWGPSLAAYTRSLEVRKQMALQTPEDLDVIGHLGWVHAKVASIGRKAGGFDAALENSRAAVPLLERAAEADLESKSAWHNLLWALETNGDLETELGNRDSARAIYIRAIEVGRHRLSLGRDAKASRSTSYVMQQAAQDFARQETHFAALERWSECVEVRQVEVEALPDSRRAWSDLAWTLEQLAGCEGQLELWRAALVTSRREVEARRQVLRLEPDETGNAHQLALALARLAGAEHRNDDEDAARAAFAESESLLGR